MNEPTVIEVKQSLTSPLAWQTLRVVILFLSGALLSRYFHSETVVAAGVAAITALLTFGVGVYKTVKDRDIKVALANKLPDSVAVVK